MDLQAQLENMTPLEYSIARVAGRSVCTYVTPEACEAYRQSRDSKGMGQSSTEQSITEQNEFTQNRSELLRTAGYTSSSLVVSESERERASEKECEKECEMVLALGFDGFASSRKRGHKEIY